MRPLRALLSCLLLMSACEPGDSGYVAYVPGPGFTQVMEASLELPDSAPVAVGEWVTMHATRKSGPWVPRDSTMAEDPACEEISPVTEEFEVAAKVEWRVEPAGQVSFSSPASPDWDRKIRFLRPGSYRVWAVSEGCGAPFRSNPVNVMVR